MLLLSSHGSLLFSPYTLPAEWQGQFLLVNPRGSITIVKTTILHLKDISFHAECADMYLFRIFLDIKQDSWQEAIGQLMKRKTFIQGLNEWIP
jgi:hypothetical protein